MVRLLVTLLLMTVGGMLLAQPAAPPANRTIFKAALVVKNANFDDPDEARLELWDGVSVLAVRKPTKEELASLSAVVDAALESNRAIIVTFDAASGRIEPSLARVIYQICTVSMDELSFRSRHKCVDGAGRSAAMGWQQALPFAVAEAETGDFVKGRGLLDIILREPKLPVVTRTIALQARFEALEMIAEDAEFASPTGDEARFAALGDSRALAALDPDIEGPPILVARQLSQLGDYDAATAMLRDVIKRFPASASNLGVTMAVVARQKGDLEESLRLLNAVAADHPDTLGMRYYYHRGWTLMMLDRSDEAIAAFDEGMKTQADFPWAFIKRGCSHAKVGQLARARDDIDQGIMLMDRFAPDVKYPSYISDRARLTDIRGKLDQARNATPVSADLCDGFVGDGDRFRPKSKLLG